MQSMKIFHLHWFCLLWTNFVMVNPKPSRFLAATKFVVWIYIFSQVIAQATKYIAQRNLINYFWIFIRLKMLQLNPMYFAVSLLHFPSVWLSNDRLHVWNSVQPHVRWIWCGPFLLWLGFFSHRFSIDGNTLSSLWFLLSTQWTQLPVWTIARTLQQFSLIAFYLGFCMLEF